VTSDLRRRAEELLAAKEFAAARAAWTTLLEDGDGQGVDGAALEGLGLACRALDDVTASRVAYERAYRWYVDADEHPSAAAVACALADIELSDLGGSAVAAGWLARARHHLRDQPDHPVRVILETLSAYRALAYEKDPESAAVFTRRAADLAERLGDASSVTMSKAFLGLVQVSVGELREGFALLDEATATAVAGELPPLMDLEVYCVLITACERVRDLDRMEQWAERVLALASAERSAGFATFARTRYASLLIGRGRWPEAEVELDRVLTDASGRPMTAAMAMVLRSSLRRQQGRLEEASAELEPCEREPYRRAVRQQVLAARAGIELDRGDPQAAADLVERYLRVVSPADLIERIEALEILVRARLALHQLQAAEEAAAALEGTAASIPTDAVRAAAQVARSLVALAQDSLDQARAGLQVAVTLLDRAGLVHPRLAAEIDLADVHLAAGELPAARRLLEEVRVAADELGAAGLRDEAERRLRGLRPEAPRADGMTARETEILRLVAEGLTNAEIADVLVLSPRTVERHISNIYLKIGATGPSARTRAVAHARNAGLLV
jgi:ATP/maltotriose-dependent transcriptional regulator MalT